MYLPTVFDNFIIMESMIFQGTKIYLKPKKPKLNYLIMDHHSNLFKKQMNEYT